MSRVETHHQGPQNEDGFSLIEVLIALLILSVAASIVTFNVQKSVSKVRDDAVLQQMNTTISLARIQSVETRKTISLNELHSALFEEEPRRVYFNEPDVVVYPAICPETKVTALLASSSDTYALSFGSCDLKLIGSDQRSTDGAQPRI